MTIHVEPRSNPRETTTRLQQAIDSASETRDEVVLTPGVYTLDNSLFLRRDSRVTGRTGAVVTREPSTGSRLAIYCGYGLYEIEVENPDRFEVGQGIHVTDDRAGGFYDTVATVIDRLGGRLLIDRMLNHDYHPDANGRAERLFPLVTAVDVVGASVSGLTLDGGDTGTGWLNGCRGGAMFLLRSREVTITEVEVRHYRGDGISFQQCVDIAIRGCRVTGNTGAGLHPGSGTVRYRLEENDLRDNGGCGIFYCLRTTHSLCRRNRIEGNQEAGISIGEMDTDHWIEENELRGNGGDGILFRPPGFIGGDRVRLEGNRFGRNGGEEGRSIRIHDGIREVRITGNDFSEAMPRSNGHDAEPRPIVVGAGCREITVSGNLAGGEVADRSLVTGEADGIDWTGSCPFPEVGPSALPLNGARHLGIDRLASKPAG